MARGPEHVLRAIVESASEALADAGVTRDCVAGLGIGSPGAVDTHTGRVVHATANLPGWHGMPLGERLREALAMPVAVDNDASVVATGEHAFGSAIGVEDFVCLTLGSGVGGCVFVGGQPLRGARWMAGDLGHLGVEAGGRLCNCGRTGCLEAYASAWSIAERARNRLRAGAASSLRAFADDDYGGLGAAEVFAASREGDPLAESLVGEAVRALATALADLANVLDPALFVLTGGVAHGNAELFARLEAERAQIATVRDWPPAPVVEGALGDDAGVLGGVALALASEGR